MGRSNDGLWPYLRFEGRCVSLDRAGVGAELLRWPPKANPRTLRCRPFPALVDGPWGLGA